MHNTLTITFTIIGLAINGLGLLFVAVQILLARQQIRDGLEQSKQEAARLQRQSTIDFYMATAEKVSQWRAVLPNDWEKEAIDQYTNSAYQNKDSSKLQALASYLGFFEALAVAVRSGIYDLAVLDQIAGSRILNIAQNYHDFFVKRRVEVGANTAYRSLEWLGGEIYKHRVLAGAIPPHQAGPRSSQDRSGPK